MRSCVACAVFLAIFLAVGTAQQRPCSYGRFRTGESDLCVSCAPNYVFDEGLRNTADPCVCRSGFEAAKSPGECVMCPPGKKAMQNAVCTLCEVGTFASFSGQTSCTSCLAQDACTVLGCTRCESTLVYSTAQCLLPQRKTQPGDDFSLFKR